MSTRPPHELLHEGRHLHLVRIGSWEFAMRPRISGVVAIAARTKDDRIVLVEQFRIPVHAPVIELPAGLAGDTEPERGESLLAAARRELLEETGFTGGTWKELFLGPSTPGLTDECVTYYRAVGVKRAGDGGGVAGEGENIVVHTPRAAEIWEFLEERRAAGCLLDPKVFTGLLWLGIPCRE